MSGGGFRGCIGCAELFLDRRLDFRLLSAEETHSCSWASIYDSIDVIWCGGYRKTKDGVGRGREYTYWRKVVKGRRDAETSLTQGEFGFRPRLASCDGKRKNDLTPTGRFWPDRRISQRDECLIW